MRNRTILVGIGLIGVIALAAVGWWLASPLFITNEVNEEFPQPTEEVIISDEGQLVSPSIEEIEQMDEEDRQQTQQAVEEAAAAMPDKVMDDPMPEEAEPVAVLMGQFTDVDDFYQGRGTATIYRLPDGSHLLRLEGFEVTNGPDLHVFLSGTAEPTNRAEVMTAPGADLGPLKGNVGDQNYTIPPEVDISSVQSVVIYCVPFHVIFSTAAVSGG